MDTVGSLQESKNGLGGTISKLVREIRRQNLQPTHFLLVVFAFSPDIKTMQNTLRKAVFDKINGFRHEVQIQDDEDDIVHLTWRSVNKGSAMIYYTKSRFEETYVRQLTKGLIRSVHEQVLREFRLNEADFNINFIATKNLEYAIDITTGEVMAVGNPATMPNTPMIPYDDGEED